jgi:hypothetical protein
MKRIYYSAKLTRDVCMNIKMAMSPHRLLAGVEFDVHTAGLRFGYAICVEAGVGLHKQWFTD